MEEKKYNPNFDGNVFLRSCEKEVVEPIVGKITGTIPLWLNGSLIRNGPGQLKVGQYEFKHAFDSMALLQRFHIENGKVTFQCRFLQSDVYKANTSANRIVYTDFGTSSVPDPCKSIFQRVCSYFQEKEVPDNALVSVYPFGDELYAFCETPFMFKVNKETLETGNKVDLRNVHIVHHTSHPHITEDGDVYNLGLSINGPKHCIMRFPSQPKDYDEGDYSMYDKVEVVGSIPARWRFNPSYMHTFGITKNYFVILEQPTTLNVPSILINRWTNSPVLKFLKFFPNEFVQISVVSRKTGELCYKFTVDTFFYMHIINQYEDENHIVLDLCSYEDHKVLESLAVEALRNVHNSPKYSELFNSIPIRIVLPLLDSYKSIKLNENLVTLKNTTAKAFLQENGTIHAKWEVITDARCELPTINYQKFSGVKYKYFYAMNSDIECDHPESLLKVNVEDKTTTTWHEDNCHANEAIFIPSPDAQGEDDGILLSNVVWGAEDTHRTGLIVLDAKTMTEIGRAVFETPNEVTKGFHGWYCAK